MNLTRKLRTHSTTVDNKLAPKHIYDLKEAPAWLELSGRLEKELVNEDLKLESSDFVMILSYKLRIAQRSYLVVFQSDGTALDSIIDTGSGRQPKSGPRQQSSLTKSIINTRSAARVPVPFASRPHMVIASGSLPSSNV